MLKFVIKHYKTMMHAHPLKNPEGKSVGPREEKCGRVSRLSWEKGKR